MASCSLPEHSKGADRLAWVDQLRTMVIILVVNMHACVTYSHIGGWPVKDGPDPLPLDKMAFAIWQGHLQSFFMGLLFLLAGYFAHGSLRRRGPAGFMRERLFRLGAPTLLYMVVLNAVILFVINPKGNDYGSLPRAYLTYLATGRFLWGSGPMWFTAALLVFSAALAWLVAMRPTLCAESPSRGKPPGAAAIWAWGLLLVAATFLVRTVEPLGTSVLNMQLCFFPQYVVAFVTGFVAAKGAWLVPLARSSTARRAGWLALVLGPIALVGVSLAGGVMKGAPFEAFAGGWNVRSLGIAAWEQLAGLGLGLGALAFCSGKLNEATPLSRWLSDRSFGVYLLHPPVLILLTLAFRPLVANGFFKVSLLTGVGLVGSFIAADLARRVPGLRSLL
jgi:glucan biosynthesis protein C